MAYLVSGCLLLQGQAWVSFKGAGLKSKQIALVTPPWFVPYCSRVLGRRDAITGSPPIGFGPEVVVTLVLW